MKLSKLLILLSTLSVSVCNAGTVPCNGFKFNFKNHSPHELVIDNVYLHGGTISTADSSPMDVNKNVLYTVNSTNEGGVMTFNY